MTGTEPKKSDLGVRVASAIVMVAVAGTALWLGGWVWTAFVAAVALGVLWEWRGLVARLAPTGGSRLIWAVFGLAYVSIAAAVLIFLRTAPSLEHKGVRLVLFVLLPVLATDIGAYFAGQAIGGLKIAPRISPSKTWAGLAGGAVAAGLVLILLTSITDDPAAVMIAPLYLLAGALIAIVAQTGDFFESWMKRRAGVKDSGSLIPGHGGLFDRVDGLLAVLFVFGVVGLLFGR